MKLKIGDRVTTVHGEGIIVGREPFFRSKRYGVKLDNSPFIFQVAYYFHTEISKVYSAKKIKLNK